MGGKVPAGRGAHDPQVARINTVPTSLAPHGTDCREGVFEHCRMTKPLGAQAVRDNEASYPGFREVLRIAFSLVLRKSAISATGKNHQANASGVLFWNPALDRW